MTADSEPPLCVDLDGTLIEGDTLVISAMHLLRRTPWVLLALPFVLLRGRAALKAWIAGRYIPDPSRLVWREDVIDFVRQEHIRGRTVFLVTAAHRLIADSVSRHLGLFAGIVATEETNAKGIQKVVEIRKLLGRNDFDYIGDSRADLPVFVVARRSYLVSPSPSLRKAARLVGTVAGEFPPVVQPGARTGRDA